MIRNMDLSQSYQGSKGVREYRLEEPPSANLAAHAYREESASHHEIARERIRHTKEDFLRIS